MTEAHSSMPERKPGASSSTIPDVTTLTADAERLHAALHAFAERLACEAPALGDVLEAIRLTRAATRALTARDLLWQTLCGLRAGGGKA